MLWQHLGWWVLTVASSGGLGGVVWCSLQEEEGGMTPVSGGCFLLCTTTLEDAAVGHYSQLEPIPPLQERNSHNYKRRP